MTTKQIIEEVFAQAENGRIEIKTTDGGLWVFNTRFQAQINGKRVETGKRAVVNIPSFQKFEALVDEYLAFARDFYADDQAYFDLNDNEFSKKLFHDMMTNVSNFDCFNIERFVTQRIQMLLSPSLKKELFLGEIQGKKLKITIAKNRSNLEGPYRAKFIFSDENGESFELPSVSFGIIDQTCYLFAVQNLNVKKISKEGHKEKNKVQKDIDRYFRKLNNGVDMEDIMGNVSPNALASLTLFNAILKQEGVKEIVSPIFMPLRYESNKIAGYMKSKNNDESKVFLQKHNRDQFNITNKLAYLYFRYAFHFPDADCNYDEDRQEMHMVLPKTSTKGENIIYDLDRCVTENSRVLK